MRTNNQLCTEEQSELASQRPQRQATGELGKAFVEKDCSDELPMKPTRKPAPLRTRLLYVGIFLLFVFVVDNVCRGELMHYCTYANCGSPMSHMGNHPGMNIRTTYPIGDLCLYSQVKFDLIYVQLGQTGWRCNLENWLGHPAPPDLDPDWVYVANNITWDVTLDGDPYASGTGPSITVTAESPGEYVVHVHYEGTPPAYAIEASGVDGLGINDFYRGFSVGCEECAA